MRKELNEAVSKLDAIIDYYHKTKDDPQVRCAHGKGRTDSVLYMRICMMEWDARNLRANFLCKLRSL